MDAGPYAFERKTAGGIGRNAFLLLSDQHDRRIGHGPPRQTVDDAAVYGIDASRRSGRRPGAGKQGGKGTYDS